MSIYIVYLAATGCYAGTGDEGGQEAETRTVEGPLADAVLEFGGLRSGEIRDEHGHLVATVRQRGGRTRVYDADGDELHTLGS